MNQEIEVILSIEQFKNLMVFLNRVEVKGVNEAAALVDLSRTLNSSKPAQKTEMMS